MSHGFICLIIFPNYLGFGKKGKSILRLNFEYLAFNFFFFALAKAG